MNQKPNLKKIIFMKIRQTIDYNFFVCTLCNSVLSRFGIYVQKYVYTEIFEKNKKYSFEIIVLEGTQVRVFPAFYR